MENDLEYIAEKRVAVVMYGGVSLAIYMAGVAQELLNVVRATGPALNPPKGKPLPPAFSREELSPIELVYRDAATATVAGKPRLTNVTIDIISGTSAGGINGIFLAKALANDLKMKPIIDLWVEEGDIAKLLNDKRSVEDLSLRRQKPPAALLNGERMYQKLVAAFDKMDESQRGGPRFDAKRVDLYVTTTDIEGELIRLPVANDAAVREKMHRQRFKFTTDGRHDFDASHNPVLAFAARCSSSFPFAFEPFTWEDAKALTRHSNTVHWTDHLLFVGRDYDKRAFADGGCLDNKPFTYAIDELARRQSHLEVDRLLLYVEPDPQMLEAHQAPRKKPDAFENLFFALNVARDETIQADLRQVVTRNARIAKIVAIEEEVTKSIDAEETLEPRRRRWWARRPCEASVLRRQFGPAYVAYHRVRVNSIIDELAETICSNASIGRPELAHVVRDMLAHCLRSIAGESGKNFLRDVDFDFHLRKFSFILRRLNRERGEKEVALRRALQACYDDVMALRGEVEKVIAEEVCRLRANALSDDNLQRIAVLEKQDERMQEITKLLTPPHVGQRLATLVADEGRRASMIAISARAQTAIDVGGVEAATKAYRRFECYDMAIYPIVRHGEVDEAVPVKVVRISPRDGTLLRVSPRDGTTLPRLDLAGKQLGHFGAFLEKRFRRNDIAWGRLDAASTILQQVVGDAERAQPFIERAHAAIANEQLQEDFDRYRNTRWPHLAGAARGSLDGRPASLRALANGDLYRVLLKPLEKLQSAGRAAFVFEKMLATWNAKNHVPMRKSLRIPGLSAAVWLQMAAPGSRLHRYASAAGVAIVLIGCGLIHVGQLRGMPALTHCAAFGVVVALLFGFAVEALRARVGDRLARWLVKLGGATAVASGAAWHWRSALSLAALGSLPKSLDFNLLTVVLILLAIVIIIRGRDLSRRRMRGAQ